MTEITRPSPDGARNPRRIGHRVPNVRRVAHGIRLPPVVALYERGPGSAEALCEGGSSSASAPRKDRKQKNPNARRTHAPIDIGDQYLNIGRYVLLSIIMCQKRSGLPRSAVSKMPLTATQGNAT